MGVSLYLKASIEHLEGGEMCGGADMTTLGAVSLTWNYTRINHLHQFLPFEIVLYM